VKLAVSTFNTEVVSEIATEEEIVVLQLHDVPPSISNWILS
jgi:hypothetical protein